MKKAVALVLSATTVLFLASGMVVGCGTDKKDKSNGSANDAGGDSGADSGKSDSGSDSAAPTGASPFGGFCDSDAACEDGLTCLKSDGNDWYGGGPAGGFCSLPCSADPTACDKYPNSTCLVGSSATEAYCFEDCQRGQPVFGEVKCHNRVNSACLQVTAQGDSACLPTCGFDGECPTGRHCDLVTGVCVDQAQTGLPIGAACDPDADQDPCAGLCITLDTGYSVCSGYCTVSAPGGCFVDPTDTSVSGTGFCFPLLDENDTTGDTGVCLQRCDCDGTCSNSVGACLPFPGGEDLLQAKGLCFSAGNGNPGLACSADGGTDSGVTDGGADSGAHDSGAHDSGADASH